MECGLGKERKGQYLGSFSLCNGKNQIPLGVSCMLILLKYILNWILANTTSLCEFPWFTLILCNFLTSLCTWDQTYKSIALENLNDCFECNVICIHKDLMDFTHALYCVFNWCFQLGDQSFPIFYECLTFFVDLCGITIWTCLVQWNLL